MKLGDYIKDRIVFILLFILYSIFLTVLFLIGGLKMDFIVIINSFNLIFISMVMIIRFIKQRAYFENINKTMEHLNEKFLISEIMKEPRRHDYQEFYKIIKKSNKSMMDEISVIESEKQDYQEYIEAWVHEIKKPITSSLLVCENYKSDATRKIKGDIETINNKVEQVLFYARANNPEKDYLIKDTELDGIVNQVIQNNRQLLMLNEVKILKEDITTSAYTDGKWISFILNQVILNAIKYKKEKGAFIKITSSEIKKGIQLTIQDNGVGIKESEIHRVFDKGFTGSNGRNHSSSTGVGLYLCKKLTDALGIEIKASSSVGEGTLIQLIIPKGDFLKM